MSGPSLTAVVGLVAANSLQYVACAFSSLNQGKTVVNLRSNEDIERISAFDIKHIDQPETIRGWYDGPAYIARPDSEGIAQILFTSGTEGKPKSILISHRALANTTKRLVEVMEITAEIREYIGVPANYSFGFGRCRVVSSVGGKFFIPENGFDPAEIASMLEAGEINSVSAVPTLWRIVLSNADLFKACGSKLRWIEIGSQYMSRAEKETLKSIFPNAKIVQHYGLTEASRTTFLKIHDVTGPSLESVGVCIDDSQVQINQDGRIEIRGSHLASAMIKDGFESTLTNTNGWFETSDLGRIEDGYLFYEGRADDQINCGGIKLSPDHIEQIIYDQVGIRSGVAVAAINDPMRGQLPLLAYESGLTPKLEQLVEAYKAALGQSGVAIGNTVKKIQFDVLPTTATGKVQRKKISEKFEDQSASSDVSKRDEQIVESDSIESKIKEIWQDVLGIENVPTDVSFFDLGGDSLSSISVALRMEKLGVEKTLTKKIFEGHTIREIADETTGIVAQDKKTDSTAVVSQSVNLARGVLVLLVILAHWMPGVVERLPPNFAEYNKYLSTLYSFGTPGFATIFGIGVGFFYLLRYLSSPDSLNSMIRRNAIILFSGMTVLAIVRLIKHYLEQKSIVGVDIANAYFSVLYFYFFAVISMPLFLRLLTKSANITYAALGISVICYAVHIFIDALNIAPSHNGIVQAGVLLLTTKYNYFEMMAGLAIGTAIGNWVRENQSTAYFTRVGVFGGMLFAFSIILCWEMGDWEQLMIWPKGMALWSWAMYAGLVCMLWSVCVLLVSQKSNGLIQLLKSSICCIGILAFPMFIGHEMVIPLKDVLSLLGLPFALLVSMALFFGVSLVLARKIYKIYYGS